MYTSSNSYLLWLTRRRNHFQLGGRTSHGTGTNRVGVLSYLTRGFHQRQRVVLYRVGHPYSNRFTYVKCFIRKGHYIGNVMYLQFNLVMGKGRTPVLHFNRVKLHRAYLYVIVTCVRTNTDRQGVNFLKVFHNPYARLQLFRRSPFLGPSSLPTCHITSTWPWYVYFAHTQTGAMYEIRVATATRPARLTVYPSRQSLIPRLQSTCTALMPQL